MDQTEDDPKVLARKIEQASRIASGIGDRVTAERLMNWVGDLRARLRRRLDGRKREQEIRNRARELWEHNGRPPNRDLEFWLLAEAEVDRRNEVRD
jgi:hypothetical protein